MGYNRVELARHTHQCRHGWLEVIITRRADRYRCHVNQAFYAGTHLSKDLSGSGSSLRKAMNCIRRRASNASILWPELECALSAAESQAEDCIIDSLGD